MQSSCTDVANTELWGRRMGQGLFKANLCGGYSVANAIKAVGSVWRTVV